MLSIFIRYRTHPPCRAGIIMTITIAMTATALFTLLILLCNMDDSLKRKYTHLLKKQRTILTICQKQALLQTPVRNYMMVDWFRLALLLRLSPSAFRSIWSIIRSPTAVVA